jgi:hypothetical protein
MGDQIGFGYGMGDGQGSGDRPEQETETGEYLSRVRGKPQAGEAVRVGDATGPNKVGRSLEATRDEILSSLKNDADPLTDQRLPKEQQDHVREYYKRFEKGL